MSIVCIPILFAILEFIFLRKAVFSDREKSIQAILAFLRVIFIFYLVSISKTDINVIGKVIVQSIYVLYEIYIAYRVLVKNTTQKSPYDENKKFFRLFIVFLIFLIFILIFIGYITFNKDTTKIANISFAIWIAFVINFGSAFWMVAKQEAKDNNTSVFKAIIQILIDSYQKNKTDILTYLALVFIGAMLILHNFDFYGGVFLFVLANLYAKHLKTSLGQFILAIIIIKLNVSIGYYHLYAYLLLIYNLIIAYKIYINKN